MKKYIWFLGAILVVAGCKKKDRAIQIPTKGLIAYYPFSGNADDFSGNMLNGTVEGAKLTEDRFNKANSAYLFSENFDVITVDDNDLLNFRKELTISVWVNLTSGNINGSRVIDKSVSGTAQGYLLDIYNPSSRFDGIINSIRFIGQEQHFTEQIVRANEWTHLLTTYGNGLVQVYMDGQLIHQKNEQKDELLSTNNEKLQIGNDIYGAGPDLYDPFHGKIDDIRIYNRVLSKEEINALLNE